MINLFAHSDIYADKVIYGPDVTINWWVILLATVVAMLIGSVWYGPLFGKRWMELVNLSKKEASKNTKMPMAIMFVLSFVQAVILAHFIAFAQNYYAQTSELTIGILTGFWLWAGFVLPALGGTYIFARKSSELIKIDTGNSLLTLLVIGAIIATLS